MTSSRRRRPDEPACIDRRSGVYALFDRLRSAHPGVEFETCASGGGRVDFGIFERTERAWTSDSIDALDRQEIQRGFSLLFPPELMGSHIGSPVAHTTGRSHGLGFRAIAAIFGSLGIEWNLLKASDSDRADLAEIIAMHKRLRPLLHHGDVVRVDHPDPTVMVHGVVAADRSAAVFACTRLKLGPVAAHRPIRLPGLDQARTYDVVNLPVGRERWGPPRRQPAWLTTGLRMTGQQLAAIGFSAPVLLPGDVDADPRRRDDLDAGRLAGFDGALHGGEDLDVPGAAAQVARQTDADFFFRRRRVATEQRGGRHDHARRAEATLHPTLVEQSLLQRMQFVADHHTLDGHDRAIGGLGSEVRARVDRLTVDQHHARSALAVVAPFLGTGQADLGAQHADQVARRIDRDRVVGAVDVEVDRDAHDAAPMPRLRLTGTAIDSPRARRAAASTARRAITPTQCRR